MHNQEQNWQNLFGDIPAEGISWHGTWTRYSPDQEVLTSFQGVRNFVPNQDNSQVMHRGNPYDSTKYQRIALRLGVVDNLSR
jgi:hypothetical protein